MKETLSFRAIKKRENAASIGRRQLVSAADGHTPKPYEEIKLVEKTLLLKSFCVQMIQISNKIQRTEFRKSG